VKKKKQKRKSVALIGRRGPAQNLRPAGVHRDRRRVQRQDEKLAVQQEVEETAEEP